MTSDRLLTPNPVSYSNSFDAYLNDVTQQLMSLNKCKQDSRLLIKMQAS